MTQQDSFFYDFLGIITLLIAVVTINNNIVGAQWVETPPRYTCPTGNMNKMIIHIIFAHILEVQIHAKKLSLYCIIQNRSNIVSM